MRPEKPLAMMLILKKYAGLCCNKQKGPVSRPFGIQSVSYATLATASVSGRFRNA